MVSPLETFSNYFRHKKVLVLGLGVLGGASQSTITFVKAGCLIRVSDLKKSSELLVSLDLLKPYPIEYHLGEHRHEDVDWADVILRNPSVPWAHEILEYARSKGKEIVMDAQLFVQFCGIPTLGITGTRGKSTTTLMTHAIIKAHAQGDVFLGGNLANQPLLPLLEHIKPNLNSIAVLELSSWQLQAFHANKTSVNVACLTNLFPDHLNFYASLDEYYTDKKALFKYQSSSDHVTFLSTQPEFIQWSKEASAQVHWFDDSTLPAEIELKVPGLHNRLNASAAYSISQILNIPKATSIQVLNQFQGVPYRLQTVRIFKDVRFINDTTATTPIAASVALNTITSPKIVIAGGHDKNLPLEDFATTLNQKAKGIILLEGSGTNRLLPLLDPKKIILSTTSFAKAIQTASNSALAGDAVLLSPGFASFGMFVNEFDRGQQFNELVASL